MKREPGIIGRYLDPGSFPGRHAGASLKRLLHRLHPPLGGAFPRQTRRGLIEARGRPPRRGGCGPPFPGRHAGASLKPLPRPKPPRGQPPFPGRHAGASLKPLLRQEVEHLRGVFPRQTRRGLIEAGRLGGGDQAHHRPFPGRHAGASLKLGPHRAVRRVPGAFPGRHAGASLKRAPGTHCRRPRRGFPRQTRRGLIEAPRLAGGLPDLRAAFPGRHAGASLKPE